MQLLTIAVLLPLALGLPSSIYSDFQPARVGDSRSPCPALNSLANHNILPRNGRGISLPILIAALKSGLNVGADFSTAIGSFGLSTAPALLSPTFDLDNLDKHGAIEHDGSLSRVDYAQGNDSIFHQELFNTVLSAVPAGQTKFDFAAAAKGRYNRVIASKAVDPFFVYTPKEVILSYGETALYLSVMGNPVTGDAPVSYVKTFFESERLPYTDGWRPSPIETNLASLAVMVGELQKASPFASLLNEYTLITESTLTAVFSGQEVSGMTPCSLGGTPCQ